MKVVFRTDAARFIGSGHVMRCLTLAEAMRARDAAVSFVCREHEGHLCDLVADRGFPVSRLSPSPAGIPTEAEPVHAAWLGAPWQTDAEQTRIAIHQSNARPEWLVVDHYAIEQRWEGALRPSVGRIMAIDDLADRVHDCDLLLDQNLVDRMSTRYAGKVPAACKPMLGPEYALLQPIYSQLRDQTPLRQGPVRRIFVFFGGADRNNVTGRVLSAFLRIGRSHIEVDTVVTAGNPHEDSIRRQAAQHSNIHVHTSLPTLAPLMAQADLAIGAAGATTWERLCLGLPCLVVTLAENQRPIAEELSKRGLIYWLGHEDWVGETIIAQALGKLLEQSLDKKWSQECFATTDGRGVDHVCAALTVASDPGMRVRRAKPSDEALLLVWANDPATRRNAFNPAIISAESHHHWFQSRLGDSDGCRLYIVETSEGVPLGQVRFEKKKETWHIDYSLGSPFRGRRLGSRLLELALSRLREDCPNALVLGQVKESNRSSRKVFESLGFASKGIGGGAIEYKRVL